MIEPVKPSRPTERTAGLLPVSQTIHLTQPSPTLRLMVAANNSHDTPSHPYLTYAHVRNNGHGRTEQNIFNLAAEKSRQMESKLCTLLGGNQLARDITSNPTKLKPFERVTRPLEGELSLYYRLGLSDGLQTSRQTYKVLALSECFSEGS